MAAGWAHYRAQEQVRAGTSALAAWEAFKASPSYSASDPGQAHLGLSQDGYDAGARSGYRDSTQTAETPSTGKTFLEKLNDLLTYNQNMEQATNLQVYGQLFGNDEMKTAGETLRQSTQENYLDSVPEFQHIVERGVVGAADAAESIVDALGYVGQKMNQTQLQEIAQQYQVIGDVFGNDDFKGAAQHLNAVVEQSKEDGLQDYADFGDRYRQNVEERYADVDITKTGQVLGNVSEAVGGMIPSAAANTLLPGSGLVLSGLSAGGRAAEEALTAGACDEKALLYGTAVGTIEAATEKIFDGMAGIFGKGSADEVIEGIAKRLGKSEVAQQAVVKIANGLGEGFEEFLSEFGTRLANELTVDTDDRGFWQTMGDGAYSFVMGSLVSGIIQTADSISDSFHADPGTLAQSAAAAVAEEIRGIYRAVKPQNVELPTVPIINLSMQDVADLNGGTLPQAGNYIRKTAIEQTALRLGLDENSAAYIEASNVTRNGEAYVLKITKHSLKKMLSASSFASGIVPLESVAVLSQIERIVQNGVWTRSEGDRYSRDQIAGYDYLTTTVYIDNQPYLVDMRVRVADQKASGENTLYFFTPELIQVTKKEDGGTSTTGRHAPSIKSEIPQSSAPIIPQTGQGGNTQFAPDGPQASTQEDTIARFQSDLDTLQRQNGVDALEAEYQKYLADESAENARAYLESEFQDVLEKAQNGDTILLSEEMENHIAQKPYSEIEGLNGKLSNRAVRKWYLAQNAKILEAVSTEGTLEERARRAFDLRNQNRVQARDLMQDQKARAKLDVDDANATFEEKMADKMSRKGMTWEEALRDVLATAGETRKSVNKMLGLED